MPIHFITGKPGGGKSMYGVRLILDELLYGTRPIVTNLPLKIGELNAFVQKLAGERVVSVVDRIRILSDDETSSFWTYRLTGRPVEVLAKSEWSQGKLPSYSGVKDGGVMYVIDEVHNFFGARQWAETGRDVLFYLSQHRKLGDTVVCITQACGNVDKQFRSVAQDFTEIRNLSKIKMGLFKLPYVFMRQTYPTVPTGNVAPLETGTFRLDVSGLAACYDTSIGVGIHARGADVGERRRGIPWQVGAVGAVVLVIVLFYVVPNVLAKAVDVKPMLKAVPAATQGIPAPAAPPGPPAPTTAAIASVMATAAAPEIWCTSVVRIPGVTMSATLSNGRRYKLGDGQCTALLRNGAVVNGRFYELRDPPANL